jgi:hypothetical protein
MQEMDNYLRQNTSFSDQRVYQDCRDSSRIDCFDYLEEQGAMVDNFKKRPLMRHQYETRIDILTAADIVYRFFLPLDLEAPTVSKFWGAINLLIQVSL